MSTVEDYRSKWWTVAVAAVFIAIPSVIVTGFFLVPTTMFLGGAPIADAEQHAVFLNVARSLACGDYLAIVICAVQVRTADVQIFALCTKFLVFWIGLENVAALIELATYGKPTDPVGEAIDFIDLLLQGYMLWKLRSKSACRAAETETLV